MVCGEELGEEKAKDTGAGQQREETGGEHEVRTKANPLTIDTGREERAQLGLGLK